MAHVPREYMADDPEKGINLKELALNLSYKTQFAKTKEEGYGGSW